MCDRDPNLLSTHTPVILVEIGDSCSANSSVEPPDLYCPVDGGLGFPELTNGSVVAGHISEQRKQQCPLPVQHFHAIRNPDLSGFHLQGELPHKMEAFLFILHKGQSAIHSCFC